MFLTVGALVFLGLDYAGARLVVSWRWGPPRRRGMRRAVFVSSAGPLLADAQPVHGTGFYALQYPQARAAYAPTDPRKQLTGLTTPTLIVKGSCDYLSWSSATDYLHRLTRARLVYLHGAGHNVQQDKPAITRELIVDLLEHRPLVIRPYHGATPPADYQGPP